MRILVVDDTPEVRNVIIACLKEDGYEVVEAEDAETALRSSAGCDAVICDVHMPGRRNGLEVAEAFLRKDVPVLLCTGDHLLGDMLESVRIRHLCKPFALTALMGWVDEMSSLSRRCEFVVGVQIGLVSLRRQMGLKPCLHPAVGVKDPAAAIRLVPA